MFHSRSFIAVVCVVLAAVGCDSKKPTSGGGAAPATVGAEAEGTALAGLETQQTAAQCRTVLQQLDNLDTPGARPVFSETEREELKTLLRLSPAEATEVAQNNFTVTDSAYLEECLLIRAGLRGLKFDGKPAIERARIGFDWACRQAVNDDRLLWPSPPWWTLQGGSGIPLSRAYLILAVWQQLGLNGCLVGPPALKTTMSLTPNKADPEGTPLYAPVRACGVKIEKDVLLFDPDSGQPILSADGKSVLTLAQAKASADLVKKFDSAEDAATWLPYLAPPLAGLSKRMEWLESKNPGVVGVKLFVDARAQRALLNADGTACEAWNVPDDPFSPPRIIGRYAAEEAKPNAPTTLKDRHRVGMVPLEHFPRTNLTKNLAAELNFLFARPFEMLRYTSGSPRDLMLRGQFREATASLEETKKLVDNARDRMEQDATLRRDFEEWGKQYFELNTKYLRARRDDPAEAPIAEKELTNFRSQPKNVDVERAFVWGNASRPLGAEVAFLMASCVHERAERAQLEGSSQAVGHWKNASDWWGRFLDASAQAQTPFLSREKHAQAMLVRCRQFSEK